MERSKKMVTGVTGLIILVCMTTILSLCYAWHMRGVLDKAISENVREMMAASRLEIALLRQKQLLASYLMEKGNPEWLQQLEREEASFRNTLKRVGDTMTVKNQQAMLRPILDAYDAYDWFREEVISLQKQGNTTKARRRYLNQVNKNYQKVSTLVDEIITVNKEEIQHAVISSRRGIWHLTFFVVLSAGLTVLLALSLLWFLYKVFLHRVHSDTNGSKEMNPFTMATIIGAMLGLKRKCPKCGREQIVPASRKNSSVPCKFCGAKIPPKN